MPSARALLAVPITAAAVALATLPSEPAFAQPAGESAPQTPVSEVDLARRAYLSAQAEYEAAREALTDADQALASAIEAQSAAAQALDAQHDGFRDSYARFASLQAEMQALQARRDELEQVPGALAAEIRELERQLDALATAPSGSAPEIYRLRDRLKARKDELAEVRAERRRRIEQEIEPQIAALETQLENWWEELLSQPPQIAPAQGEDLLEQWTGAALTQYEAQRREQEALATLEERTIAYYEVLGQASPPILQELVVQADGRTVYDLAWVREPEDATEANQADSQVSIDYARKREQLARMLESAESSLARIRLQRNEGSLARLERAQRMHEMAADLAQAAEDYGDALEAAELAKLGVEIGVALTETALTGGASTLARKGEEIAQRVAQRRLDGLWRNDLVPHGRSAEVFEDAVLDFLERRGQSFDSLAEAVEELERRNLLNAANQAVMRLNRRALEHPGILPDTSLKHFVPPHDIRKASGKLAELRRDAWLKALAAQGVQSAALKEPVQAGKGILAGNGIPVSMGSETDGPFMPVSRPDDVATQLGEKSMEWAVGAGVDAVDELLASRAAGAAFDTAEFGRQAGTSALFSVIEQSLKSIVESHFSEQANAAHIRFSTLYAKLAAMYRLYYESLQEDRRLAAYEQKEQRFISRTQAYLSGVGMPRRAVHEREPAPIPASAEAVTISMKFSAPLTVPPQLSLAGEALPARGAGRYWKVTFTPTNAQRESGPAALQVSAGPGNAPYPLLDADPGTIAWKPLRKDEWQGWEKGADRRHTLAFENHWDDVLGRWRGADVGGVIELRRGEQGTLTIAVVELNAAMRKNHYRVGQTVGRGFRYRRHGLFGFYKFFDGEIFRSEYDPVCHWKNVEPPMTCDRETKILSGWTDDTAGVGVDSGGKLDLPGYLGHLLFQEGFTEDEVVRVE